MNEKYAKICLDKLFKWANSKGYQILKGRDLDDCVIYEDKIIHINTRVSPEKQVYTLLHECGHIVEYKNGGDKYKKKYPISERIRNDGRSQYSFEGRVATVEEEISAWRNGKKIANSLGLLINEKKYDRYAAVNVISYIDWAASRSRKSPESFRNKVLDKPWEI